MILLRGFLLLLLLLPFLRAKALVLKELENQLHPKERGGA